MGAIDKASNKAQDIKGRVKEKAGQATGNKDLQAEGKTDQVRSAAKDVGEKVKDARNKAKHLLHP